MCSNAVCNDAWAAPKLHEAGVFRTSGMITSQVMVHQKFRRNYLTKSQTNVDPPAIEPFHRNYESLAFATDKVLGGDGTVLKDDGFSQVLNFEKCCMGEKGLAEFIKSTGFD